MLGTLVCSRVYMLAGSCAWHAYVLWCLRACMLTCLACLVCLCAYVLSVFACLRAWRACVRACMLVMMKCFIFLHVCVLRALFCLICFTFQYLNLKIVTVKNLRTLFSCTYFLFTFQGFLFWWGMGGAPHPLPK